MTVRVLTVYKLPCSRLALTLVKQVTINRNVCCPPPGYTHVDNRCPLPKRVQSTPSAKGIQMHSRTHVLRHPVVTVRSASVMAAVVRLEGRTKIIGKSEKERKCWARFHSKPRSFAIYSETVIMEVYCISF